jgi:hypothetical protein
MFVYCLVLIVLILVILIFVWFEIFLYGFFMSAFYRVIPVSETGPLVSMMNLI